jgi:hypothetical protein
MFLNIYTVYIKIHLKKKQIFPKVQETPSKKWKKEKPDTEEFVIMNNINLSSSFQHYAMQTGRKEFVINA